MIPYLLIFSHLFFKAGVLDHVDQGYTYVSEHYTAAEIAGGQNNDWACEFYKEKMIESAGEDDAYVAQCLPAGTEQPKPMVPLE